MNITLNTDEIFFSRTGLNKNKALKVVEEELSSFDDGELFLEYSQNETLSIEESRIKSAAFGASQGFGLRALSDESTGYAHSSTLSESSIYSALEVIKSVRSGKNFRSDNKSYKPNQSLYSQQNPIPLVPYKTKVETLEKIDSYARKIDNNVRQVSASLNASWQAINILRVGNDLVSDIRPLVRINVSIVAGKGKRIETGSYGTGGRVNYEQFLKEDSWKKIVKQALDQALTNLESKESPGGEMPVVLGPGWPGILLHEAVGHGLEGDFHRKKTSAFSNMLGQKVAADGVTVIDDGTIPNRRGSINIDDEGTPTTSTTLIENGILVGLMQDKLNSRIMNTQTTGNGRRESYAHPPMPRMTNTFMANGNCDPEEIIKSVNKGLYAVSFGGGQVDITSGKFVFSATEAYLIENGKITAPVKGATLIGNGPDCLTKVSMIGNDMRLDPGIGTCGKEGQGVPVGVGQPTLKIDSLTVGGTAV